MKSLPIEIDENFYSKNQIQKMDFDNIKMLIGFTNSERILEKIRNWRSTCYRTTSYINILLSKI